MAKAILEFDLTEVDDELAFMRATKSLSLVLTLLDVEQYLRIQLKYNEDNLTDDQYKMLDKVRDRFYEILSENGINLDQLVR
jgi:hypothetical protein